MNHIPCFSLFSRLTNVSCFTLEHFLGSLNILVMKQKKFPLVDTWPWKIFHGHQAATEKNQKVKLGKQPGLPKKALCWMKIWLVKKNSVSLRFFFPKPYVHPTRYYSYQFKRFFFLQWNVKMSFDWFMWFIASLNPSLI